MQLKKSCLFEDKCNYDHGEHELKYTILMDLDRAGLIDIKIYRTNLCPTWISTGAYLFILGILDCTTQEYVFVVCCRRIYNIGMRRCLKSWKQFVR